MSPREAAETKVKDKFEALKVAKRTALDEFIEACREANDVGVSDKRISDLINGEYARSSICQLRNKEQN